MKYGNTSMSQRLALIKKSVVVNFTIPLNGECWFKLTYKDILIKYIMFFLFSAMSIFEIMPNK